MGCDIHLHAEIREHGRWHKVDPSFPCRDCNGTGTRNTKHAKTKEDIEQLCWWCKGSKVAREWYGGRNYDLFAMLADVRNGRGFAGCYTGSGFKPISDPKGLPSDVCWEIKEESDRWGCDGHSHSYLTVKELLEYPVDDMYSIKSGIMDVQTYHEWKEREKTDPKAWPAGWCGGISGPNVVTVDEEELPARPDATHVVGEWPTSYRECAEYFFGSKGTLAELQKLTDKYGEDNVRIVFWFDN
jgi:hypothetical protein